MSGRGELDWTPSQSLLLCYILPWPGCPRCGTWGGGHLRARSRCLLFLKWIIKRNVEGARVGPGLKLWKRSIYTVPTLQRSFDVPSSRKISLAPRLGHHCLGMGQLSHWTVSPRRAGLGLSSPLSPGTVLQGTGHTEGSLYYSVE